VVSLSHGAAGNVDLREEARAFASAFGDRGRTVRNCTAADVRRTLELRGSRSRLVWPTPHDLKTRVVYRKSQNFFESMPALRSASWGDKFSKYAIKSCAWLSISACCLFAQIFSLPASHKRSRGFTFTQCDGSQSRTMLSSAANRFDS